MSKHIRTVAIAALFTLSIVSCKEKKAGMSSSEVNARIDSMVGERVAILNEQAMEDLNDRLSIEVKVKADSILAERARRNPAPAAVPETDTVTTP